MVLLGQAQRSTYFQALRCNLELWLSDGPDQWQEQANFQRERTELNFKNGKPDCSNQCIKSREKSASELASTRRQFDGADLRFIRFCRQISASSLKLLKRFYLSWPMRLCRRF